MPDTAFQIAVVTPDAQVFDRRAGSAVLPAHDGEIGILRGRAPLLCKLGIGVLPESVVDYLNPVLFYSVLCEYREALAKVRNHPLETRRYMGKVEY